MVCASLWYVLQLEFVVVHVVRAGRGIEGGVILRVSSSSVCEALGPPAESIDTPLYTGTRTRVVCRQPCLIMFVGALILSAPSGLVFCFKTLSQIFRPDMPTRSSQGFRTSVKLPEL